MPVLFAATLFLSAFLLFMVQPMVGKMILPLLGGSPAAWNTCMVFFQGLLLLGYFYSHKITGDMLPKRQTFLHVVVLALTCSLLILAGMVSPNNSPVPIFRSLAPQGVQYPMFGVLALLMVAIGLPFMVVSTSAPLLQRWFNYTGHESSKDPYFLYAASNAGSLLSLLGYPIFIEPQFTLVQQAWIWAFGFLMLTGMVYFCGKMASDPPEEEQKKKKKAEPVAAAVSRKPAPVWSDKLRWIGYAFVPSSLMLGVTFHMTTDIASVPLLWVIPLALYLLTFIIAFARVPNWFRPVIGNLSPVMTLLLVFVLVSGVTSMGGFTQFMALGIHLIVYFTTALLMHYQLASERPEPQHLTEYFIWISVGGVLGGIFNALVAPMLFPQAYEYPIAIAVGCLLIPILDEAKDAVERSDRRKLIDSALDFAIPLLMIGFMLLLTSWAYNMPTWLQTTCNSIASWSTWGISFLKKDTGITGSTIRLLLLYALPCVVCFFFIDRPIRFGLCVAALLGICYFRMAQHEDTVAGERSFFGILRVEKNEGVGPELFHFLTDIPADKEAEMNQIGAVGGGLLYLRHSTLYRGYSVAGARGFEFHRLLHGTTLHGIQAVQGNALAHLITDPNQLPLNAGRANVRELATEAMTRNYINLLGSANSWDALLLGALPTAWDFRQEPLTYYHRTGPVGEIFRRLRQVNPMGDIGMVGLGTGSVACYALPGQRITFYEIDTAVIKLVEDGKYFTYVKSAKDRGAKVDFVLGDARLQLEEQKDRKFAALLVDAFSSDSIPIHLLTRESLELYKERLAPNGLLALHISNRYVDLEPVVAKLAEDAKMVARIFSDNSEGYPGKTASSWVVLARTREDLGPEIASDKFDDGYGAIAGGFGYFITDNPRASFNLFSFPWRQVKGDKIVEAWRDDYADVLRVMRMEEIQAIRRWFGLPILGESND